jgi:hypothetical protein
MFHTWETRAGDLPDPVSLTAGQTGKLQISLRHRLTLPLIQKLTVVAAQDFS